MIEPYIDPRCQLVATVMGELIPFNVHLGVRVHRVEPGYCILCIPWADHLTGDWVRPAVHGGVTSTLIDTTGGAACLSRLTSEEERVYTVDLRVDYLRPGPPTDLYCEARVVRMGNKVAVARMELFAHGVPSPGAPERERPVATGQGVYNVYRPVA